MLFHPEADARLVDAWLAEAGMVEEARNAIGPEAPAELKRQARAAEGRLVTRSTPGFLAFADLVESHPPHGLKLKGDQRESNPHCRDHNAKFYR